MDRSETAGITLLLVFESERLGKQLSEGSGSRNWLRLGVAVGSQGAPLHGGSHFVSISELSEWLVHRVHISEGKDISL